MTLNQDDLFRNAIPGYVFFIVVLSFYAVGNRLDALQSIGQPATTFVLAVAGFPLGFIIHALYRIVFHDRHWPIRGESDYMDNQEAEMIKKRVNDKVWWENFENKLTAQEKENIKSFPMTCWHKKFKNAKTEKALNKEAKTKVSRTLAHFMITEVSSFNG